MNADEKKSARLNCIAHLLSQMPYQEIAHQPIVLPEREHHLHYKRNQIPADLLVPEVF